MKIARAFSSATRSTVAFLTSPPLASALYVLYLAWRASRANGEDAATSGDDERMAGRDAEAITSFVRAHFGGEVTRTSMAIASAAIVLGALVGIMASSIVRMRDRLARRGPRSSRRMAVVGFVVAVVLHAWLVFLGMARTPQLYADAWYARGGMRRTVQVMATDVLGPSGVVVLGVLMLLVYLAGPPSKWGSWGGRLRRAFLPHGPSWRRRAPVLPALTALAILALAPLSFDVIAPAHAEGSSAHPNVIVIAADSLRADRLTPRVAPHLDALAGRGTRFERAYASELHTFPSCVTLLTGRHAHHHGVRTMFPRWEDRAKDFDALPQRLARAGYRTSVVSDYAGDIFTRIDLGFDRVDAPTFNFRQLVRQRALEQERPLLPLLLSRQGRRAFPVMRDLATAADPDLLAEDAIRAIDSAKGAPFFLTVFFSTAHFPYAAPAPYYDRFTRASYRGRFKYGLNDKRSLAAGASAPPDAEDIAEIRGLYDGAVASIDAAAGRILEALRKRGLDRDTVVVITSDHGETLFENGRGVGHGDHLFGDEGTHVPLVIVDPRHPEAHRERRLARDVDLAPTLYALTGVTPPADLDGRSLMPALTGAPLDAQPAFAETSLWLGDVPALSPEMRMPSPPLARLTEIDGAHQGEVVLAKDVTATTLVARHRMVRDDRWKLVYLPTRTHVVYMLFDTERDPGETHDVAAEHPTEVARLKGELWRWMLRDPQMTEKGGYLVVRDAAAKEAP